MKIVSLTNSQVAIALRLGGIKECYTVESPEKAGKKLLELTKNPEIGILLIDDDIARIHHKTIDDLRKTKQTFPIIVEIQMQPKKEATKGKDPLQDLIKRAIGVDISAPQDSQKAPKI
jgi:vacuolar-type H+-ATPase subunit F/Vma7